MSLLLENLRKAYVAPDGSRLPVIDIARLELADGEQVALVGTSGSGKTTLLHLIAGILTPDSGRIWYEVREGAEGSEVRVQGSASSSGLNPEPRTPTTSVDLAQRDEAWRDVFRGRYLGYIFQTHHLLPGFTALENVMLGMSFTGRGGDGAWARHLLHEVGLAERMNYKPQKLSVGQQQRVAVARALANRPQVVLADEPTGALDTVNAQQVLQLIRKLCTEVGATLLLVSHDPQITGKFERVLSLAELNRAAAVFGVPPSGGKSGPGVHSA